MLDTMNGLRELGLLGSSLSPLVSGFSGADFFRLPLAPLKSLGRFRRERERDIAALAHGGITILRTVALDTMKNRF